MKNVLIGIIVGIGLTAIFFLIRDFFKFQTSIPKNHVTVRLHIDTKKPIDKLTLTSSSSTQIIELKEQTETVIIFPNPGEGTFKICCSFKNGEEICSIEAYVEGGYSPILKIRDSEIEAIEWH